jgi:hypothetical protein
MILVLHDQKGVLYAIEAAPEEYREITSATVFEFRVESPSAPSTGMPESIETEVRCHDAWGPMALVNSKLICRDLTQMLCLDLGKRPER